MILTPTVIVRIILLGGPSFGMGIAETATKIGRPLRQGSAASTLLALERKKHVERSHRESTGYNGHPRVYYRLTSKGHELAEKELVTLRRMALHLCAIAANPK